MCSFIGKKVLRVEGNTKIEKERMVNKKILFLKSWGKHFLVGFSGFTLKIHFLMFGSYKINEPKDRPSRLSLFFNKGEINFYSCSVKFLEEDVDELYDWSARCDERPVGSEKRQGLN
jgi:endonuclease-8